MCMCMCPSVYTYVCMCVCVCLSRDSLCSWQDVSEHEVRFNLSFCQSIVARRGTRWVPPSLKCVFRYY